MPVLICLFWLVLAGLPALAESPLDSIRQRIARASSDSSRGRECCQLANYYRHAGQPDSARAAAQRGLALTRRAADVLGQARCLLSSGFVDKDQGDYAAAREAYLQALQLARQHGFEVIEAASYNNLGNIYEEQGQLDSAEAVYRKALDMYRRKGESRNIAICLGNLAVIFESRGQYAKAIDYYLQALRINRQLGDRIGEAITLLNIGVLFTRQKEYDKARKYFEKSLVLFKETGNELGRSYCVSNLGSISLDLGDYKTAEANFKEALELNRRMGNRAGEATELGNLARIATQKKNWPQAMEYYRQSLELRRELGDPAGQSISLGGMAAIELLRHNYAAARRLARESLELGRQADALEAQKAAAQHLCSADSALGNWRDAFEALLLFKTLSDSARNEEKAREVGRLEAQYEYEQETKALQLKHMQEQRLARLQTRWIAGSASGALLLVGIIAFTLFRGRKRERQANHALRALNEAVSQQKAEIEAINAELLCTLDEIQRQKELLTEQHEKITDSIRYAWRIQQAILPSPAQQTALPPHFILYQPRDIVSGDFYWFTRQQERTFIVVADCTGHGVPGAFMSVLGVNLLQQIVVENHILDPGTILNELNTRLSATLKQDAGGETLDGMDVVLVALDEQAPDGTRRIAFAAANRPLWQLSAGELHEYRGQKYPCGGQLGSDRYFDTRHLTLQAGDRLYLFSDGLVDQFGGPPTASGRRPKYGSARLRDLLTRTADQPLAQQYRSLESDFQNWRGPLKQLDDLLIIGIEA